MDNVGYSGAATIARAGNQSPDTIARAGNHPGESPDKMFGLLNMRSWLEVKSTDKN